MEVVLFAALMIGLAILAHAMIQMWARMVRVDAVVALATRLAREDYRKLQKLLASVLTNTPCDALREAAVCGAALARAGSPASRDVIDGQLFAAFDTAAATFVARWRASRDRALAGGFLVFGTIALAVGDGLATALHAIAGGVAACTLAIVFVRRTYARTATATFRAAVVPAIAEAIASGSALAQLESSPPAAPGTLAFTVEREGVAPRTVVLTNQIIKVGSIASAHLHLANEPDAGVSRMHAIIERIGDDGAQIIDLGSTTGTIINGTRVNKAVLATGDRIAIGAYTVSVALGGALPVPPIVDDGPLRTAQPPAHPTPPPGPSLRDGTCPICHHTIIKTIARTDSRFEAKVCAGCGFTQEFADLAKL